MKPTEVRLEEEQLEDINYILDRNRNFESVSHFIRSAVYQKIKEEKDRILGIEIKQTNKCKICNSELRQNKVETQKGFICKACFMTLDAENYKLYFT